MTINETGYIEAIIMHDQFMLLKLVLNTNTMKFHKSVYPFSLFQQVPYFE